MRYYVREFKDILFMGNKDTKVGILKLQKLLNDCVVESGGLQQSPQGAKHPSNDPNEWAKEYIEGQEKIKEMIRDIAMALTGEEITFS